ncbi:hypothetical protein [Flavobacterium sp. SLB02]|uniref:hypothetical protein n=1 Tax=Flavobacterium sp. SLB02 TaxID=2665645 RepID=UPI0012A809DD|nr:hypothetical protein [Flavobacterium sp. SLB02]QGK75264.1 hypothetical protein GIY83_14620 [Flavobacterium sp. SLB02]
MKKIYLLLFAIITANMYSQKSYDDYGYYVKFGNIVSQNDSVVNYQIANIIFKPSVNLKKTEIKKIIKISSTKKNILKYLKKKGDIYYIIPQIKNIQIFKKYYDTIAAKRIFNGNKNTDCISFLPSNIVDFVEIRKIEFNGIKEKFRKELLQEIFPTLKNEGKTPLIIESNGYVLMPNKEVKERLIKKRVYFDFNFQLFDQEVYYSTVMIYDCKIIEDNIK